MQKCPTDLIKAVLSSSKRVFPLFAEALLCAYAALYPCMT